MENNCLTDAEFLNVEGYKAFHFINKYTGKNLLKDPTFNNWYKEEKNKNNTKFRIDEDRNEIIFCSNCQNYLYDTNRSSNRIKCCNYPHQRRVCIYCGSIFYPQSYCCLRNSIKYSFREYLIDGLYFCSWCGKDCIKSIPIIFKFLFVNTIINAFFFRRQIRIEDFDTFGDKENLYFKFLKIVTYALEFIYLFIFYFPLTIAYIIYLYFYFQISLNQFHKEY